MNDMSPFDRLSGQVNPLLELVGTVHDARPVGFTIRTTYSEAILLTNDRWRAEARGIQLNGYLVATSMDPTRYGQTDEADRRVVLLRVMGRADLVTDGDTTRTLTDFFQKHPETSDPSLSTMETFAKAHLQWSGMSLKVLGTFYLDQDSVLRFGADVEDFFAAHQMRVYKPGPKALEKIVNFVDPKRLEKARSDAAEMGMGDIPASFPVGHVRFTSTVHLDKSPGQVPVTVFPGDFLARRTAVFGMTRTGKSNTTKTMVSAVALCAFDSGQPIGQLIFDINGEYSNANRLDKGSIADAFRTNTVRYRALGKRKPGFRDICLDFYKAGTLGVQIIAAGVREDSASLSEDMQTFCGLDLEKPQPGDPYSMHAHYERQLSIYQCILYESGYPCATDMTVDVTIGARTLAFIGQHLRPDVDFPNEDARTEAGRLALSLPKPHSKARYRLPIAEARDFWKTIRGIEWDLGGFSNSSKGIRDAPTRRPVKGASDLERDEDENPPRSSGKQWLNDVEQRLLCVLCRVSTKGGSIRSIGAIREAAKHMHSPRGSDDVGRDVYDLLRQGRIVILDLSTGSNKVRQMMADKIALDVFHRSMRKFTEEEHPPRIVMYVEEAHNLIGKKADLDETWPRIAKEGAKYGISLVYATQEPSSIHPNILSNTENLFVTHLNNDDEIRTLSRYYDFSDFALSLKTCPDVGFARVKTLSSPFVVPVQISEFDVRKIARRFEEACSRKAAWFVPLNEGI